MGWMTAKNGISYSVGAQSVALILDECPISLAEGGNWTYEKHRCNLYRTSNPQIRLCAELLGLCCKRAGIRKHSLGLDPVEWGHLRTCSFEGQSLDTFSS